MIIFSKSAALMAAMLFIASCASQRSPSAIPVVDRSGSQYAPPQKSAVRPRLRETGVGRPTEPVAPGVTGNAAVASLLEKAVEQKSGRHYVQAGATLERAVRISPRNAEIYYQLAEVRLLQENRQQAQQLCQKAMVLAGQSSRMKGRCSGLGL